MNLKARDQEGKDLFIGGMMCLGLHLLLILAFFLIYLVQVTDVVVEVDEEERSIEVRLEPREERVEEAVEVMEVVVEEGEEGEREEDEVIEVDQREKDPDEEEEEEEESEEEESEESEDVEVEDAPLNEALMELYAVDQEPTEAEVEPEDAQHVADQAHVTEEETVAEVRTLEKMEPVDEHEAPPEQEEAEWELAMSLLEIPQEPERVSPTLQEEREESEELQVQEVESEESAAQEEEEESEYQAYREPSELILEESEAPAARAETPRREQLFRPEAQRVDEVLGQGERAGEGLQTPEGRRLLSTWKDNEEALRASLENFLPHVETGNHTSVNARAGAHASYIARIHRSIHPRWALGFIPRVQDTYSNAHPLNDMDLMAIVEIVIDAETGRVEETGIVQTSGNTLFDAEALMVSRDVGAQPDPPSAVVSPDGKVYIHWSYWRDQRQCGTFGVRIYRLQDESERRAIPELDFSEAGP